ncbi:MAG: tyrosine-type recombinase/integrase [Tenuifilaceae bacterium]|nr:tyrosine-type recombinase/integrase [Tenuifilaceae bacterium]
MLTQFLKYIQVERNYSVQTIRAYGDDLRQFFAFCNIEPDAEGIKQVNHRVVRAWLAHLLNTEHTARSVNRKLSSLRSFYKYLLKQGVVTKNPMQKVVAPKASHKMPYFLSHNETDNLLQLEYPEGFFGLRDLLVIELFYFLGLRVSELVSLKESDISISTSSVKILGKGSKERIVPLYAEVLPLLVSYIKQKNDRYPSNQMPYLIVSSTGKKAYPQLLYRIVKKYLSLVTPLEKKSPHVLRHTFATHLLNQGADINAIKELLGHASLSTTQIYTHTSVEKLKNVYKQAHPRA